MIFRTDGKPAPGQLLVVQGFLNTWSDELAIEDFKTTESTETWLRQAGLWKGPKSLSDDEAHSLRLFRQALRDFVQGNTTTERIAAINGFISEVNLGVSLAATGEIRLVPRGSSIAQALGQLVAIIHSSMIDGCWRRFKVCELPSCGWAFYDSTRNRSGRWCSMKTCGSRHKARQYLKRKADKSI
jgi:predicted RNA-binding Zn ribbon-like protein